MRWRWPWRPRNGHDAARVADAAEEQLRQTRHGSGVMQRLADDLAQLSNDEYVDRVSRAFRRRPT